MTPLEKIIGEIIAAEGPMPIDRYMGLCLGHPVHGYYMSRDPFGEQGDFMTAPEISQIFGELIGVWCAAAWAAMDRRIVKLAATVPYVNSRLTVFVSKRVGNVTSHPMYFTLLDQMWVR